MPCTKTWLTNYTWEVSTKIISLEALWGVYEVGNILDLELTL